MLQKTKLRQNKAKDLYEELDFDYHSLRHTHATKLVETGANPKDIQFRLGHKDIRVTLEIYAELTEKMQIPSLDIIENIF